MAEEYKPPMSILPAQSGNALASSRIEPVRALDSDLAGAYAHCRRVTREASKSFFLASRLVPQPKREAIEALYAFARTSDDVVDRHAQPIAGLEAWIAQVRHQSESPDPVLQAWSDTCRRYAIPEVLADELLAGVGMDLTIDRYQTFSELEVYCYRVASVVGLLSMRIIGFAEGAEPYAIQLGIALQLTNILRDVGEDAARGRIYLPLEDLHRFGISEQAVLDGVRDDRFRALMRWQIARAEALYQASWPGIALLHRDGQFAVAAAALLYRGILTKIVANDFDVFHMRACLSRREKLLMLPYIRLRVAALRGGNMQLPALRAARGSAAR